MMKTLLVTIVCCLLLQPKSLMAQNIYMRTGYAYDKHSNELLYIENHHEIYHEGLITSSRILYTDIDNTVIARKSLDFSQNAFIPEFKLSNIITGQVQHAIYNSSDSSVSYTTSRNDGKNSRLIIPANAISDHGLDNFISKRWDDLMVGETFIQKFLMPDTGRLIAFNIFRSGLVTLGNEVMVEITLKPENIFNQENIETIYMHYNPIDRRLRRFDGVSSLPDSDNKNSRVIIDYHHTSPVKNGMQTINL